MSIKRPQTITHFDFTVYLQITFKKYSILHLLDKDKDF